MKTLKDIENLKGVKVLVRADFNVPIKNGVVVEDFRIRATLPTIEFLRKGGARIILISHLESNDGQNGTLQPVADKLVSLGVPVKFVKNIRNAHETVESDLADGECLLLENLRSFEESEINNELKFAKALASLADIYVNEAFSVSHREHASLVGVPKLIPGYAGTQLEKEIAHLSKAFNPPHPFLFVLGGAKFETKLPLLEKFLVTADHVFVGGALANDFFKAKGYGIGSSLVSKGNIDLSPYLNNSKIILPIDIANEQKDKKLINDLSSEDKIMDSGPKTIEMIKEKVLSSKFILWNGPLGLYENGYQESTLALAKIISEATSLGAETIVGGGDTLAAIAALGLEDKFTFISTGGGAMLDFLAKGTLPAIEALNESME